MIVELTYSNGDKLMKQRSTLADYVRSLKYTARVAGTFVGHEALVRSELFRALYFFIPLYGGDVL